jgi:hypothetical protein
MAVVELQILSRMCSFHLFNTFIIEFLNKSQIVKLLAIWIWLQRSRGGFTPIYVSGLSFCLIVVGYLFLAVAGCVPQGSRNMKEPGVSIDYSWSPANRSCSWSCRRDFKRWWGADFDPQDVASTWPPSSRCRV